MPSSLRLHFFRLSRSRILLEESVNIINGLVSNESKHITCYSVDGKGKDYDYNGDEEHEG